MKYCFFSASLFLALVSITTVPRCQAQEAVLLRYKMNEDTQLIYRTTITMTGIVKGSGLEQEVGSSQTSVTRQTLDKVDDAGHFVVREENKQLKIRMNSGNLGEYHFDSVTGERDRGSVLAAAYGPLHDRLSGAVITVIHDQRGTLREVNGIREVVEGALAEMTLDGEIGKKLLEEGIEEARLRLGEQFIELSAEAVKPGESWKSVVTMALPGGQQTEIERTYTYMGPSEVSGRTTAKIDVAYTLNASGRYKVAEADVESKVTIGDGAGTIHFDPSAGCIVRIETSHTATRDITTHIGGASVSASTEAKQSLKVELLDEIPKS